MRGADRGEQFKGLIHFCAGGLASAMCLHNAMQLFVKRDWRNGVNVAVYAGAVVFEAYHTHEHWKCDA